MDKNNIYDDNFIRKPDSVIREKLIEYNDINIDTDIEKAIQLSLQDLKDKQIIYNKYINEYENKIIEEHNNECKKREEYFRDFIIKINRLSNLDKNNSEIYKYISNILDKYCKNYINTWKVDEKVYNSIFQIINKIRNNEEIIISLKKIIILY